MAKKITKIKNISITTFDKIAKEHFPNIVTEQWFDNEVVITRTLSLSDMLTFVDSVVSSCYHDAEGYMPEIKDFVIKRNILTKYANFNLPDSLEHCYALVYGTDAVAMVLKHVNQMQFDDIMTAIENKIDYLCDSNIAAIEQQMQKVAESFDDMHKKTEAMFAGIDTKDFARLMNAISSSGNIDESKLVKAFIETKADNIDGSDAE